MKRIEHPLGVIYVRRRRLLSLSLFVAGSGVLGAALGWEIPDEGKGGAAGTAGLLTLFALIALAEQRAVMIDLRHGFLRILERHPFRGVERRVWPLDQVSVRLESRARGGPRIGRLWILVPDEPPILFRRRWRRPMGEEAEQLAADLGRPLRSNGASQLAPISP